MVRQQTRRTVKEDIVAVAPDTKIHLKLGNHYSCNWACGTTNSKSTRWVHEVTCQNCLKVWEKGAENA